MRKDIQITIFGLFGYLACQFFDENNSLDNNSNFSSTKFVGKHMLYSLVGVFSPIADFVHDEQSCCRAKSLAVCMLDTSVAPLLGNQRVTRLNSTGRPYFLLNFRHLVKKFSLKAEKRFSLQNFEIF